MALKKYRKFAFYLSAIILTLVTMGYVSSRVRERLGIPEVQQQKTFQPQIDESIRSTPLAEYKVASQDTNSVHYEKLARLYEKDLPVTRTISYQVTPGWNTYVSPVGYSLQYMPWRRQGVSTELRGDTMCLAIVSGINALMWFSVVPYNGESAIQLALGDGSYILDRTSITYEKVRISGVNAIAIYVGDEETPESGDGMFIVIPKGDAALILKYPYRSNITEWETFLRTIKLEPSLNISRCTS